MEPTTSEQQDQKLKYPLNQLLTGILYEHYAAAEGMNSSGIKEILRSPAHYHEYRHNHVESKASPALEFGKLLHYVVFEPEAFKRRHKVRPKWDMRTKVGQISSQAFKESLAPDAIVVPEGDVEALLAITEKILEHPIVGPLIQSGIREVTVFWRDPETGEVCKARPDFITGTESLMGPGVVVDLKSTRDASYEVFRRQLHNLRYHIQCAHYLEGGRVTGLYRPDAFVFIAVEKEPPYELAVYTAGDSIKGIGDQWRSNAMKLYSKCRRVDQWPGYERKARTMELPPYAEAVPFDEEPYEIQS